MFSRTPSQTPDAPHVPPTKPSAPATAIAEPPVEPVASPEPEGPAPTRRFTDSAAPCATRLGSLHIRGMLTGSDSVELSGTFEGPIDLEGFCRVTQGGAPTGGIS